MQIIQTILETRMKRIYVFFVIIFGITYLKMKRADSPSINLPKHITIPKYEVHIFYDGGFRNMIFDGEFVNWPEVNTDKDKLSCAYYPALGLYSSNDPQVIRTHMSQISLAGIGVVVVTWWPSDFKTRPPMLLIMEEAHAHKLKVTIQIPFYNMRTIHNIKGQIVEFFDHHGDHPALYKTNASKKNKSLPIIYIYKSDSIPFNHWRALLEPTTNFSIRNTAYDALYIGMVETEIDPYIAPELGFDGFYTFVSSTSRGVTFASTWYNWPHLYGVAEERDVIFIPTISPGYDDRSNLKIHPLENRKDGIYYNAAWGRVLTNRATFVAINSFNGWIHGTQIEPATPMLKGFSNYEPEGPNQYLLITRNWVIKFANKTYYNLTS